MTSILLFWHFPGVEKNGREVRPEETDIRNPAPALTPRVRAESRAKILYHFHWH